MILLALLGAVVGLGALIIPAFVHQIATLSTDAPAIQARLADFAARVPPLAGRRTRSGRPSPGDCSIRSVRMP